MAKRSSETTRALVALLLAGAVGGALWLAAEEAEAARRLRDDRERRGRALAARLYRRIQGLVGRRLPRLVAVPDLRNAQVRHTWDHGDIIEYDPIWFGELADTYCDDQVCNTSVVMGILAHEVGHWLHHHTTDRWTHPHDQEWDADDVAGQILAHGGVTAEHFACVLEVLARRGSPTHPAGWTRGSVIRDAYWRVVLLSA